MDFGDSPEEAAFRARFRDWLAGNNPGLPASSTDDEYWAGMAAWHQSLYDAGFFGLSWPTDVGGHGMPSVFDVILDDELAAAGAPPRPSLGYLVHGTHSVYFAGDTDLFPGMAQIGELNLGVALLPVWGWGPSLGPGHMDPYRAALALRLLKPRLAIPIHWGTLYPLGFIPSWAGFLSDPPHRFAWFAKRLAPEVEVAILQPGESKTVLT